MFDWRSYDSGGDRLVLVGPVMGAPLMAGDLARLGIAGVPQIAVDGGIQYAFKPALWAGDGDSSPTGTPIAFKESQDDTDLRFCLNGVRDWAWRELHLFGFLGGRRDHELANFGEIHAEMKSRADFTAAIFYDEKMAVSLRYLRAGAHRVYISGGFSLLSLENCVANLSGACDFTAKDAELPVLSGHGVSNRGRGMVDISCTAPFMVLHA